jgi:hypothetical protein
MDAFGDLGVGGLECVVGGGADRVGNVPVQPRAFLGFVPQRPREFFVGVVADGDEQGAGVRDEIERRVERLIDELLPASIG